VPQNAFDTESFPRHPHAAFAGTVVAGSGVLAHVAGAQPASAGGDAMVPASTVTAAGAGGAAGALAVGIVATLLTVAWVGKRRRDRAEAEAMARGLRRRSSASLSGASASGHSLKSPQSGIALVSRRNSLVGGGVGHTVGGDVLPLSITELELADGIAGGDVVNPMHAAGVGRPAASARGVRPSLAGDAKSDSVYARGAAAARGRAMPGDAVGPATPSSGKRLSIASVQRLASAAGGGGGFVAGGGVRSPITFAPVVMPGTVGRAAVASHGAGLGARV